MTEAISPSRRDLLALASASGLLAAGAQTSAQGAEPAALAGPWRAQGDIRCGGGTIHYAELGAGSGTPLIVMPKLGGWIADWREAAPYLAQRRRVIAIDPPGHGDSRMAGPPPYIQTPMESAAMVLAVLDELRIERADLAGNSLGGIIATAMAVQRPKAVGKLALVSVSLAEPVSREELLKQDAAVRDQFGPDWAPLPRTDAQIAKFASMVPRVNAEQNLSRAKAGVWVRPSERGVGRFDMVEALSRVGAPVLLVIGDRGHYFQFEPVARRVVKALTIVNIPQAGSFVHQEKPAEVAAAMNAFLDA